jgi:two-component system, sensor histidine kinase and response regulator
MTREEPFDLEAALAYMDGDTSLFQELVKVFVEESAKQLKEIHTGTVSGNAKLVERAAHSIKGSASTFAAKRTVEAARHLEFLGREGKFAEFADAVTGLESELEQLKTALIKAIE